jgi:acyl-lipid omega-6 desaturase (Delta-12 desaturase)
MDIKEIRTNLKKYAKPDNKKVLIQLANTFLPYIALLTFVFFLANRGVNYFILLPLSLIAGSFMVRTFILFHDCTHKSFVKTSKWNAILGNIFGFFVFTPYVTWQREHNTHHATVGNLDKRGVGDIWTLTVEEYKKASGFTRFIYRIFRHPLFLFGIAPVFLFTVLNRFPKRGSGKKAILSTLLTNLGILVVGAIFSTLFSLKIYLIYQITIIAFATSMGVWLFYIQHQFEDVYWQETKLWGVVDAALMGSSFYKLPLVLEWISGYIGYHHIHHLNSRIPNYHLKASYQEIKDIEGIKVVTLRESFKYVSLKYYDEKTKRLIDRRELKSILSKAS